MDDNALDELERLERLATPGPWWSAVEERDGGLGGCDVILTPEDPRQRDPDVYVHISVGGGPWHPVAAADQDLIAAARNAVPALVAEVRRLRALGAGVAADLPSDRDGIDRPWLARNLVKAVALLALPADDQRAWLRTFGTFPAADELALNLEDSYIDTALALLDGEDRRLLEALWLHLDTFSGREHAPLWHESALDDEPWRRTRELARAFLLRM